MEEEARVRILLLRGLVPLQQSLISGAAQEPIGALKGNGNAAQAVYCLLASATRHAMRDAPNDFEFSGA